jgi:hypothetical protein
MALRCKDGEMAIITWDYPGCLGNIGRIVEIKGPIREFGDGPAWRVYPVAPDPYYVIERDQTRSHAPVKPGDPVYHPDAWMLPIRPTEEAGGNSTEEDESAPAGDVERAATQTPCELEAT